MISDCVRCWNTPCTCGWGYRHYHKDMRLKLASVILGINLRSLKKEIEEIIPIDHPFSFTEDYRLVKDI